MAEGVELAEIPPQAFIAASERESVAFQENTDLNQTIQTPQTPQSTVVGSDVPTTTVFELPPVDEGRMAWMFCLCGFLLETLIWGWNNTYGIFQDYYTSHPSFTGASSSLISVVGTASMGIQYMEFIAVILACQRYPEYVKRAMWGALSVCVISLVASSFATQVWHLILFQGVIFGISAGILYAPVVIWLSEWFFSRRGLAGGIIFGGSGVGGFMLPLFMGTLLDRIGFRWSLRIWAAILAVLSSLAFLGLNPRVPVKRLHAGARRPPWFSVDTRLFTSPLVFFMVMTTAIQSLSYFPVSLFIPTYTSSLSTATISSKIALALFNAASVVGFIASGRLSDSYPYPIIILISSIGSALAAFLLWGFASSLGIVFAFAVVFGGLSGGFGGLWPAAATDIAGTRNEQTSFAFGCFCIAKGTAAIVGPLIAGALRDPSEHGKSFHEGFGFKKVELFVGSMALGSSTGAIALFFVSSTIRRSWGH